MSDEFKRFKLRSRSSGSRTKLFNALLDTDNEARDVKRNYEVIDSRVNRALLMSDSKIAHKIAKEISECKKARSIRSRKIRNKVRYVPEQSRDDNDTVYETIRKWQQEKLLNDVNDYKNTKGVCQSLWCSSCRHMVSKAFENKINERLQRGTIDIENIGIDLEDYYQRQTALRRPYRNDDLLHITGVVGLCEVDVTKLDNMLKRDTNRWRQIRYQLRKTPSYQERWIEVAYEFELVNWRHLLYDSSEGSEYKKKQINQLRDHYKIKDNLFLFVHFHGVCNLSKKQLNYVFEKKYFVGGDRLKKTDIDTGLYVQSLHKDNALEENIRKISSYNFKRVVRYKHSFRGSDYSNGEYFSDEELSKLVTVYGQIQKRNWRGLFRTCDNDWSKTLFEVEDFYKNLLKNGISNIVAWQQSVMTVDFFGNVRLNCWDPDVFIKNTPGVSLSITTNIEIIEKVKVGRQYFMHPHMPWLEVYKNLYEYVGSGRKFEFNNIKGCYDWYLKHRAKYRLSSSDIKIKWKEKYLDGWDFNICDENISSVVKKMQIFYQIDQFEKQRIYEKKKRGHTNLSNKGKSRNPASPIGSGRLDFWIRMAFGYDKHLFWDEVFDEEESLERISVMSYITYLVILDSVLERSDWIDFLKFVGLKTNRLISQNQTQPNIHRPPLNVV